MTTRLRRERGAAIVTGLAALTPPAGAWLGLHAVGAAGLLLVEVAMAVTVIGTALFGRHEHSERAFRLLRWIAGHAEPRPPPQRS